MEPGQTHNIADAWLAPWRVGEGFTYLRLDLELATKWIDNWSPELTLGAFRAIFRALPVGTGLGAKFGRKAAKSQIQIIICIINSKRR